MLPISTELARSTLEAAPDAMIIIDSSGAIRFANQRVTELFGYTPEELVSQSVESLMPERFRQRHTLHRTGYTENVRVRAMGAGLELYGKRRDGTEFPVEISLSPVRDGEHSLVAAAIRDVTERKLVERDLIVARQIAEREREVADRLRSVADRARDQANEARQLADRANQGKSRFLATASHDLRQPLQSLALLNGTLLRVVSDVEASEALMQQELAITAMSRLLNALLDISKLESGAIRPDPTDFNVATLFDEMRREFAAIASNKGLALRVEPAADCAHSDPSLVEQILRNLVSNAIKYTRQGYVSLRCLRHDSLVRIEVMDTGIGIPAEQLALIYDEFYQVGVPTNSSRDGYGLGLSIVHRLVQLLKLQLNVSSEVGKGSVFSLTLPAGAGRNVVTRADSAGPSANRMPNRRARVLLVEDDAGVRDATRLLLKVEGYTVTAVSCLADALRSARESNGPDLLITDYHLRDGETGSEVITALRGAQNRVLRAVLITGDTSAAVKEMARDDLLRIASKPIKAEELLRMVDDLLTFPVE